jgi:hypothetical protein
LKSLPTLFIAGLASLLALSANAASYPLIQEPLFGLKYLSADVHFEPASQSLLARCGLDPSPKTDRRSIYAKTNSDGWDYLIIGGLVRENAAAPWQDDSTGEFLRANETACNLIDPGNDTFPPADYAGDPASGDQEYPISMDVYRSLATDAVNRYIAAFGSKEEFLNALSRQHAFPDQNTESVLQATLAQMMR